MEGLFANQLCSCCFGKLARFCDFGFDYSRFVPEAEGKQTKDVYGRSCLLVNQLDKKNVDMNFNFGWNNYC